MIVSQGILFVWTFELKLQLMESCKINYIAGVAKVGWLPANFSGPQQIDVKTDGDVCVGNI